MGSPSLQPDLKDESTDLQLDDDFLTQLRDKYCCKMKVSSLSATSGNLGDLSRFRSYFLKNTHFMG